MLNDVFMIQIGLLWSDLSHFHVIHTLDALWFLLHSAPQVVLLAPLPGTLHDLHGGRPTG